MTDINDAKGLSRRQFFQLGAAATAGSLIGGTPADAAAAERFDRRRELVARHKVVLTAADVNVPLSVGNGEFAFTADVTGLQTFPDDYKRGTPISTLSQWGFQTEPSPEGFKLEDFPYTNSLVDGREVPYLVYERGVSPPELEAAANYLYSTPGRLNLGRVGMVLKDSNGASAKLTDLTDIRQELDLWRGTITSRFRFDGEMVQVTTVCHPELGLIAVSIVSPLVAKGQLAVGVKFPYGPGAAHGKGELWTFPCFSGDGGTWNHPEKHRTILTRVGSRRADFARMLDGDRYFAAMSWSENVSLSQSGPHDFELAADRGQHKIAFVAAFSPAEIGRDLPSVAETVQRSSAMWANFWSTGGSIDLSESKDPRARELQRRIILSQYLTRIQSCGSMPPGEAGLTCNTWFGKPHLEMHWLHSAHFALWGRSPLLERSLGFYTRIMPKAQAMAQRQGYEGARWPKCVGPEGDLKPSYLEAYLIWQQPHPLACAELSYRAHPNRATLDRYSRIVFETARFMASFIAWDAGKGQYRLGPPLSDSTEHYYHDHDHQWNPTFELCYWRFGLAIAQKWRERLGMPRDPKWDHVLAHMPPLAMRDGVYVTGETATDTTLHTVLGSLGMLDGSGVDRETMRRTLHKLLDQGWTRSIGWAFPMTAMTAARLGEPELAIEVLMVDANQNHYLVNGHNPQFPHIVPVYLPGNASLLYATAMMAAGWDGAPRRHAPGFPSDGSWTVRSSGLLAAP